MTSVSWQSNNVDTNKSLPPEGGYDLDLFVDKEKVVEYVCQICHDVARECAEVSCGNGHIFCDNCIRYHFELNGNVCPSDRSTDITITHNDFVRRKIMSSNVRCKYYKYQCEWIGALRQWNQHTLHCSYKPIDCKYCKLSVSSQLLHEHYLQCEEYLVRCSWCKNMYKRHVLKEHTTTCTMKPILCPNGCEEEIVTNKLDKHLSHECHQRSIECQYKKYGCNQQIKYKDIEKHNTDNQLKHMQYQMTHILAQNEQKTRQILQLQSRVTQLDGPDIIVVDGWETKDVHINGIYRKKKHFPYSMYNGGEYIPINDEQEENKENNDSNYEDILRPSYIKYEDDIECKLHFIPNSSQWIFTTNEFEASCDDRALYPTNITNNKWKVRNRSVVAIDTVKISEIDVFQQILDKIPPDALLKIMTNTYEFPQNDIEQNAKDDQVDFEAPQGAIYHVNENKTAILNPSFVHDEDPEDSELCEDVIQNMDDNESQRKRTISNGSQSSKPPQERTRPAIRVSVSSPNRSINDNRWVISVSFKLKYDQLYDDLLRREANNGNNAETHHNPFGPPMVSNQSLYRYLTSVGYDSKLIKILWKLINSSHQSSNINNLLTRNGFVAICHLLDKITNSKYKIPTILPAPLQPQQLNNLISTPVRQQRLNNNAFPDISEFDEDNKAQYVQNIQNETPLLSFNDNMFGFEEIKSPAHSTQREELKQDDFLHLKEPSSRSMDNLIIAESQTGSTASPKNYTNLSNLEPLAFMNTCIDPRSRTKPNTPDKDTDLLSVFPEAHDLVKSRSLDSKNRLFASKSENNIFGAHNVAKIRAKEHGNNQANGAYKTPPTRRNIVIPNISKGVSFGMGSSPRNDLDDLWDQMNPNYLK